MTSIPVIGHQRISAERRDSEEEKYMYRLGSRLGGISGHERRGDLDLDDDAYDELITTSGLVGARAAGRGN